MEKYKFMGELEKNLMDISYEERREALRYYEDYFDEAGDENIESVMQELGTPQKVAKRIKEDLHMENMGKENGTIEHTLWNGEETEQDKEEEQKYSYKAEDFQKQTQGNSAKKKASFFTEKLKNMGTEKLIILILVCIIVGPAILGILCGIVGIFIGIFFAIIGLIFGAFAGMAGMFVSGVVSIVVAFGKLAISPANSLVHMGAGIVSIAIALLFLAAGIYLCKGVLPGFISWFNEMIQKCIDCVKGWMNNERL